jgi:polar amino acid transport system substrate-binding protein
MVWLNRITAAHKGSRDRRLSPLRFILPFCFLGVALLWTPLLPAQTYTFVGSNFPILSEQAPDGTLTGIGVEIVRTICNRLGHTPSIRLYPWARAQALVRAGEADVLIAPYKTPEREKWMDYTETPFFEDRSHFFIPPRTAMLWDGDLAAIRDKRIGMVNGWSVGPAFEKEIPNLTIDFAPTIDLCFKKLLAGRVDVVPTQEREATAAFRRLGLEKKDRPVTIEPVLATHFNYYGFSKHKHQELLEFRESFERELKKMYKSGEIEKLLSAILDDPDGSFPHVVPQ